MTRAGASSVLILTALSASLACGGPSKQRAAAEPAVNEPTPVADTEPKAEVAPCAPEETIFRCTTTEGALAQWCVDGRSRVSAALGEGVSISEAVGEGAIGWCSFTSPHMSHEAAYVGPADRRLILRMSYVNPEDTEFHGDDPESMPHKPTWEVIFVEGQTTRRAACAKVDEAALYALKLDGVDISRDEGCDNFGE